MTSAKESADRITAGPGTGSVSERFPRLLCMSSTPPDSSVVGLLPLGLYLLYS